jgi:hypothetical protein
VAAKADGDNPGFQITTPSGTRYLLKFDNKTQWERASAADVVGSRLYFAAGFHAPCNRVIYFRPADLQLPEKPISGSDGKPLTRESIEVMLKDLPREQDGTLRGLASEFLPESRSGPGATRACAATTRTTQSRTRTAESSAPRGSSPPGSAITMRAR